MAEDGSSPEMCHVGMMDFNCIVFEAYFEGHSVTLFGVLCTFFIGFPHFGNKILHCFAQDPKKQDENMSISWYKTKQI